jgi:N-formylglutamate amidohydrolase
MVPPVPPGSDGPPEPVLVRAPLGPAQPIVVCSPHSGRFYPPDFLAAARPDLETLRRSEDCLVDELFADAPAVGAWLVCATHARTYLDVNREPFELDPATFAEPLPVFVNTGSPRVAAGFGTIAHAIAGGGPIYRHRLPVAEAAARVRAVYRPYHERLAETIGGVHARFGHAIVLDCHSMPSTAPGERIHGDADVVLGDRFGRSCAASVIDAAERFLLAQGWRVKRNDPYAGGFTTEHYGRPDRGVHALQVEMSRALYMDESRLAPTPAFARVRATMRRLVASLAGLRFGALAAE